MNFNVDTRYEILSALAQEGKNVTLRWNAMTPNILTDGDGNYSDPFDPVTGSCTDGTVAVQEEVIKAFVHVIPVSTVERKFAEVQAGDAIFDIHPDVVLDGREGLELIVNVDGVGETHWEQKNVGEKLSAIWDALEFDKPTLKTILCKRKI